MFIFITGIVLYAILFFYTKGEQEISLGATATIVILNAISNIVIGMLGLGVILGSLLSFGILTVLIGTICKIEIPKAATVSTIYIVVSIIISLVSSALASV